MHFTNGETGLRETGWPTQRHIAKSNKPEFILKCNSICPLSHQAADGNSKEIQDRSPNATDMLHFFLFLLLLVSLLLFCFVSEAGFCT